MGFSKSLKRIGAGVATGGLSEVARSLKKGPSSINLPQYDPYGDRNEFNKLGDEEQLQRQQLGQKQQGQINTFAADQAKRAADYRATLAKSLSDTSANTFKSMNPGILEDLNSRGLFTSQTARDQEQGRLLADLANTQNQQLSAFDTSVYNDQADLFGTGLNATLGGDQAGLDSALAARKAGLTRQFNNADTYKEQEFAAKLARRQAKDQLTQALIGAGGQVASAFIKKGG